ncbi:TonB-dependent receptor [Brevundimonas bacteroides]|uniref:TonB-dependent receptor n=1 Tax=Brevundimonas bacteroides TaxID=74311 RepID=UPI0006915D13|nr:TonB-dependent receptor [Brevundimonas bacteroides]
MRHITRSRLLATTIFAGAVVAAAAPANAQTAAPQEEEDASQLEEVVVTGSRIRRNPANAPTPLIQVSREDLLTSGQSTVIDYLATIPALSNSQVPSDTTGALGIGGLALPNLRSLGTGRTLTLVDGRRHIGSAAGSLAVDADSIPRLLIENIEIVTGGASSVYGADAVSGVLNFVLRDDFEGLEIDANYGMINQDGQTTRRLSALWGANLLDDTLNVYGFAEHEESEAVYYEDIDWMRDGWGLVGNDVDPSTAPVDGDYDNLLWRDIRSLGTTNWGTVTLANAQPSSMTTDADVPVPNPNCTSALATPQTTDNCFPLLPGLTYVFSGPTARLANFGQRIGNTGYSRGLNIGGDGVGFNTRVNVDSSIPQSESQRFQVGFNFDITPNIELYGEAKAIFEDTYLTTGPNFNTIYLSNLYSGTDTAPILSSRASTPRLFTLRLDNAFLPTNLQQAILSNTITNYTAPTATSPGVLNPATTRSAPYARYSSWTTDRDQANTRDLQRFVLGARGSLDQLLFVKNLDWDLGYTYGRVDITEREGTDDGERFSYAADAVVDTAGVLGTPGRIVCRAQLLTAGGGTVTDRNTGLQIGRTDPDIAQCVPLNVFGEGNQSAEALAYIRADINYTEENTQQDFLGTVGGQLWDFWGAGPIGVVLGYEYRKETTEGTGRSAGVAGRWLQGNTGGAFLPASYEANEGFAELSLPLFRDLWLGDYAELSGSYRYSDFSTTGGQDVYGVNLVYRLNSQLALRSSVNTSIRAPALGESFAPQSQTFFNNPQDPCDAQLINNLADRTVANQRIANCTTLLGQLGLAGVYSFSDPTAANAYRPTYPSGIAGRNGGNPALLPEDSESFTFSTVWTPDFIPNFSLVLDYFEIEINNVIAAITAQTAVNQCVTGVGLNGPACATIFRGTSNLPTTAYDDRFQIADFIQGSINYARRETRGLDFTANYSNDIENLTGWNLGRVDYRLAGTWLIQQSQFNDIANPGNITQQDSELTYPRVRLTQSVTYAPTDTWSVNWTMDWQTAQDIVQPRALVGNGDNRAAQYLNTRNFARHDFTVRADLRDDLSVRFGVVNAFDSEPARWLAAGVIYNNFDPYGRRFFIGLNYRPW